MGTKTVIFYNYYSNTTSNDISTTIHIATYAIATAV